MNTSTTAPGGDHVHTAAMFAGKEADLMERFREATGGGDGRWMTRPIEDAMRHAESSSQRDTVIDAAPMWEDLGQDEP